MSGKETASAEGASSTPQVLDTLDRPDIVASEGSLASHGSAVQGAPPRRSPGRPPGGGNRRSTMNRRTTISIPSQSSTAGRGIGGAQRSKPRLQNRSTDTPVTGLLQAQHGPGRRRNWRTRKLIQDAREHSGIDPDYDLRLPVILQSVEFERHSFSAIFSSRVERSTITASATSFLGLMPMDLPPDGDSREPFESPWGNIIYPKRYVRLLIEQVRNDLPLTPADIIVLDEDFPNPGADLILGRRFLKLKFGGKLPPRASATRASRQCSQQLATGAENSWRSTMNWAMSNEVGNAPNVDFHASGSWAPLTSVGAPLQTWGHPGWCQQGGQLPYPQDSRVGTYQGPPLSWSHVPIQWNGTFLPNSMQPAEIVPSLQDTPQWTVGAPPNFTLTQWPSGPMNDQYWDENFGRDQAREA